MKEMRSRCTEVKKRRNLRCEVLPRILWVPEPFHSQ